MSASTINPPSALVQTLKEYLKQNKSLPFLLQKYYEVTNEISQPENIRAHNDIFKDDNFIDIWFFYIFLRMHKDADEDSEDTKSFLKYLKYNGIGRRRAWLYILSATFEIFNGDKEKALKLIEFGKDEKNQVQPQYLLDEAIRILESKENVAENMYILMETCAAQSNIGLGCEDSSIFHYVSQHFRNPASISESHVFQNNIPQAKKDPSPKANRMKSNFHYKHGSSNNVAPQEKQQIYKQNMSSASNHLQANMSSNQYRNDQPKSQNALINSQQLKQIQLQNQSNGNQRQQVSFVDAAFPTSDEHSLSPKNQRVSAHGKRKTIHDDGELRSATTTMQRSSVSSRQDTDVLKSPQSHLHSNTQRHYFAQNSDTHFQTDDLMSTGNVQRYESQELFAPSVTSNPNAQTSPNAPRRTHSTSSSRRSLVKSRRGNRNGPFDPTSESLLDSLSTSNKKHSISSSVSGYTNNLHTSQNGHHQSFQPNMKNFSITNQVASQSIDALALAASSSSNLADERPRKRRRVVTIQPQNSTNQGSIHNPSSNHVQGNSSNSTKLVPTLQPPSLKISINGKDFTIIEQIGRGGSSRVYKVVGRDRKIFALKRVTLQGHDESTAEGFKNEVALLKELQNEKYIVQLIDYEEKSDSQELLLLMECGDIDLGGLLRNHAHNDSKHESNDSTQLLRMNSVRVYWEQMLLAVNAIHRHGIVHGDLKPANFLLVKGAIKLIDFGIAQKIQHEFTSNIVRDTQVGTLNYIPPEALKEVEGQGGPSKYKLGMAADVWSLGCILYQMVTGSPPFSCYKSAWKKIMAITSEEAPIDYSKVESDMDLLEVLKCCLQRNPQKRMSISGLLNHSFLNPTSRTSFAIETIEKLKEFCNFFDLEQSNTTEVKCQEMLNHLKEGGSFWGKVAQYNEQMKRKKSQSESR